jgi:hypothetical protein
VTVERRLGSRAARAKFRPKRFRPPLAQKHQVRRGLAKT